MNRNQEKLQKIRAHCVAFLELASKRTPGTWEKGAIGTLIFRKDWVIGNMGTSECVAEDCPIIPEDEQLANAEYVAACAGPAEAMARSTIAAIDGLLATMKVRNLIYHEVETMNGIFSAWPDELLED